jgi:uncharacterized coiled-coil DUF342 family protein
MFRQCQSARYNRNRDVEKRGNMNIDFQRLRSQVDAVRGTISERAQRLERAKQQRENLHVQIPQIAAEVDELIREAAQTGIDLGFLRQVTL